MTSPDAVNTKYTTRKHFPMALDIPATSQIIEYHISHDKAKVEKNRKLYTNKILNYNIYLELIQGLVVPGTEAGEYRKFQR